MTFLYILLWLLEACFPGLGHRGGIMIVPVLVYFFL